MMEVLLVSGRGKVLDGGLSEKTMTEQDWRTGTGPQKMLEYLEATGKASGRKLRLFAVAVSRRVWPLLTHERFRDAVVVAERFADGLADQEQLRLALGEGADNHSGLTA